MLDHLAKLGGKLNFVDFPPELKSCHPSIYFRPNLILLEMKIFATPTDLTEHGVEQIDEIDSTEIRNPQNLSCRHSINGPKIHLFSVKTKQITGDISECKIFQFSGEFVSLLVENNTFWREYSL